MLPPGFGTHCLRRLAAKEMTLDCRTLWSVRFCAAKGHFCSLLLSNILVTSAFCRLTIFSNWPSFHFPSFHYFCPFVRDALTGWNENRIDKPPDRFFWNFWNSLSLITLNNFCPYFFFQKKRWKEIFLLERCFPFVTVYYHGVPIFSRGNIVQSI